MRVKMKMNLIEISKAKSNEIPFSKASCYKFRTLRKYPELLIKVANKLYFDCEEWQRMCSAAKAKQIEEAKRIHKGI
jgi:hypothetical protein